MSGYSRQSNLARARFFIHTTVPYAVLLSCFPAFGPSYIALFSASFSRSWCFFPSMSSHFTPPHYALHQSQNVPPTTSNHMPSSHHIPTGISKGTSQFTPTRVTLHSARTFCQSVPRNPYALARHHATKLFFCLFSSEHRSHITCSLSSFGLPASTVHRISPLHLISSIFLNALPTHFWLSLRTLPKVCSDFSHHLIMTNVATNPMKCIMTSSLIQSKNTVFLWRLAYCWAKSHLFPFHRPHIPISSLLPPPLLSTAPPPPPPTCQHLQPQMSAPHLSTLVLAAGSDIWSFPTWKQRTGNVVPPLHKAASPATTLLESWELTVIRNLSQNVDALTSFRGRVRYIRKTPNSDTKLRVAAKAWHTWVQPRLSSWNIQTDIENLFRGFGRHPSQISSSLSSANANLVRP